MEHELPMKSFVLFIACGTLVFIIVFLFAKRQITRYALKSSRSPHANIGSDAPKALRLEIERRLKRIADIKFEPRLLRQSKEDSLLGAAASESCPQFFYRMKAVDALWLIDAELKLYDESLRRPVGGKLLSFLCNLQNQGPLEGISRNTVEQFVAAYDHARHDPANFKREEYESYMKWLNEVVHHIRKKRNDPNYGKVCAFTEKKIQPEPECNVHIAQKTCTPAKSREDEHNQTASDKDSAIQVTYRPSARDSQGSLKMTVGPCSQSSHERSSVSSGADRLSLVSSQSSGHFETSV